MWVLHGQQQQYQQRVSALTARRARVLTTGQSAQWDKDARIADSSASGAEFAWILTIGRPRRSHLWQHVRTRRHFYQSPNVGIYIGDSDVISSYHIHASCFSAMTLGWEGLRNICYCDHRIQFYWNNGTHFHHLKSRSTPSCPQHTDCMWPQINVMSLHPVYMQQLTKRNEVGSHKIYTNNNTAPCLKNLPTFSLV